MQTSAWNNFNNMGRLLFHSGISVFPSPQKPKDQIQVLSGGLGRVGGTQAVIFKQWMIRGTMKKSKIWFYQTS